MTAINDSKIFAKLRYFQKPFGNGHLRYIRQNELESTYTFSVPDLDAYGVERMKVTERAWQEKPKPSPDRWKTYIMKLTKKLPYEEQIVPPLKNAKATYF
jgi:hypothetical protein